MFYTTLIPLCKNILGGWMDEWNNYKSKVLCLPTITVCGKYVNEDTYYTRSLYCRQNLILLNLTKNVVSRSNLYHCNFQLTYVIKVLQYCGWLLYIFFIVSLISTLNRQKNIILYMKRYCCTINLRCKSCAKKHVAVNYKITGDWAQCKLGHIII